MWRKLLAVVWWLALSVYLGGMVGLGVIAAPALFGTVRATGATLPGLQPWMDGKAQLGGEIFGVMLQRFAIVEEVCWVVLMLTCATELFLQRSRITAVRLLLLVVLGVIFQFDAQVVTPEVWKTRAEWRLETSAEAAAPIKARFDELHVRAETLARTRVWLLAALTAASAWGMTASATRKKEMIEV